MVAQWWRRLLSRVDVWYWHSREHSMRCQCPTKCLLTFPPSNARWKPPISYCCILQTSYFGDNIHAYNTTSVTHLKQREMSDESVECCTVIVWTNVSPKIPLQLNCRRKIENHSSESVSGWCPSATYSICWMNEAVLMEMKWQGGGWGGWCVQRARQSHYRLEFESRVQLVVQATKARWLRLEKGCGVVKK